MFRVESGPTRFSRSLILFLIVFSVAFVSGSGTIRSPPRDASIHPSVGDPHRTYWLTGDAVHNWNNTNSSPGPLVKASDGDSVTIMLLSNEGATHNWFVDLPNNPPALHSPDFLSRTVWTNFTFIARLNQSSGFPHGGNFTYRCGYHPFSMFGTFEFFAGPVSSFVYSPSAPLVGDVVSFSGSASWPSTGARIATYRWDFGDGNTLSSALANITHTYSLPGVYVSQLNVTDSLSQTAGSSKTITVNRTPPVPFDYAVSISPNGINVVAGQNGTLVVRLVLVSGTPENVTLSSVLSPSSSMVRFSFNRTSGFPSFTAKLSIATDPSSQIGSYNLKILARSSSGILHNATITLVLTSNPPAGSPLGFVFWSTVGAVVIASGLTVFALLRRSRTRRLSTLL